jgi:hypothetical protein
VVEELELVSECRAVSSRKMVEQDVVDSVVVVENNEAKVVVSSVDRV